MEATLTIMTKDELHSTVESAVKKALTEIKITEPESTDWLTADQVLSRYKISRSTLDRFQKENKIKVYKLGRRNFYSKNGIDSHILSIRKKYEL